MELINRYFTDLTENQRRQFAALGDLYTSWNEQINVISRKDIDQLYEKHVLHSMSIAKVFDFTDIERVADIGTGGGFPGIPLAILFPEVSFTLIDSIGKKIKVVEEVARAIGLGNVQAVHGRAEQVGRNDFTLCVSRAVAPLDKLGNWSKALLRKKKNKGLICLKGGDLKDEIAESGLRTRLWKIGDYFHEPFFETKFIVHAFI